MKKMVGYLFILMSVLFIGGCSNRQLISDEAFEKKMNEYEAKDGERDKDKSSSLEESSEVFETNIVPEVYKASASVSALMALFDELSNSNYKLANKRLKPVDTRNQGVKVKGNVLFGGELTKDNIEALDMIFSKLYYRVEEAQEDDNTSVVKVIFCKNSKVSEEITLILNKTENEWKILMDGGFHKVIKFGLENSDLGDVLSDSNKKEVEEAITDAQKALENDDVRGALYNLKVLFDS